MKKVLYLLTTILLVVLLSGCGETEIDNPKPTTKDFNITLNNYLKITEQYDYNVKDTTEMKEAFAGNLEEAKAEFEKAGYKIDTILNAYKEYYQAANNDVFIFYYESPNSENTKLLSEFEIPTNKAYPNAKINVTNNNNYDKYEMTDDGSYQIIVKSGNVILKISSSVEQKNEVIKMAKEFGIN